MASRLTELSIWYPLVIKLVLVAAGGIVLILLMPETLPSRTYPAQVGEDTPFISNANITNDSKSALASTRYTLTALFGRPVIYLLPGAVLAMPAVTSQLGIIMRVIPIRFDWPLSRTAVLLSLNAATTLVTLLAILPATSYFLRRNSSASPLERDRLLARASVLLFVLGSFFFMVGSKIGLVVLGLIVSGLGSGVPTLCRSLLVALVDKHGTGSVFGVIAAGEVLGMLTCELVIGPLFDVGLRTWLGLPFCLGMVISVVTCLLTWSVRNVDG
jgi:MFS transporter, PCFT/HCP family, solute carrier family 46 (folate transporter), member 1